MEIHLITLEETPERERKAREQLEKYSPALHVKIHRFRRQSPGWKGCIDSHLRIFQHGKDTNAEWLWIAEDNLVASFDEFPQERVQNLFTFMKTSKDWGIIFVGGYILRPWDYCQETIHPQIYETRNNNHGTVSYIIHARLYRSILDLHRLSPIDIHYDIFLSRYKCHIYNPLLFYHAHNLVSNINQQSDGWRRLWFHPKMMKVHSLVFFQREWLYTLIASLIIIIGIRWCALKRS